MGIETNLNQSPFFDDFSENKNFHRVLFRPGYSVQARELTQLQSILQNQIERFANEILVDGTVVTGCGLRTDDTLNYVKIRDKDANNRVVLVGDFFQSGQVANVVVYGETSGMQGQLIFVEEGSEAAAPNYLTLFVKYTNSGSNNTSKAYTDNEVLVVRSRSTNNFVVAANTIASNATGYGFRATVADGIIYHKGNFVRVPPQSIVVDKYSTTPTKKLGFETRESIVDSNEDSSLLDNATGATNFSAPGANRLKLDPVLSTRAIDAANTQTFFTIANIENGSVVQRFTDTTYSDIDQYFSRRTFETNGDFVVDPFNIRIREHLRTTGNLGRYNSSGGGDVTKLVAEIEKGSAYVAGNRVSIESSIYRDVDKATTVGVKDARIIGQAFGNYVICREVVGTWDFQGIREVDLYDAKQNAISGGNLGLTGASGNKIGTARVRGLQWHEGSMGTSAGKFRIYLFDVKMNPAKSFSSVRSLYVDNTTGPNSLADIVLETNGSARLQEASLNTLVFPFTQTGTKTLKDENNNIDTQYVFRTERTVNFENGVAIVSANTAHAGGTETLNDTGLPLSNNDERNIIVVGKAATQTEPHTGYVSAFSGNTVTLASAVATSAYKVGDLIKIVDGSNTIIREISEIPSVNSLKVSTDFDYTRSSVTLGHRTVYPTGYIYDLSANGEIRSDSTQHQIDLKRANLESSFIASVYFNVLRSDAVQTSKTVIKDRWVHINTQNNVALATGPWYLGVSDVYKIEKVHLGTTTGVSELDPDVTDQFELETGMKDAFYDTSSIRKKPTSTVDTSDVGLLVKFSHFGRDRSSGIGFLSVDSYPIDDTNVANTTAITTQEIPVFVSPTSGKTYDLRDSIDFRPIKQNSITPSLTANGAISASLTNPVQANNYNVDSSGAYFPTPDENFQADIQFYLPRIDKIILTKEGSVEVVKGIPNPSPQPPDDRPGSMTLAQISVPVYPSLSPYVSKQFSRPEYQVKINLQNNRRYTMRDIRVLDDRINNLEYYSSLNALEASAKSKQIIGETGIDRFKNGFLVDNFDGHNVADTTKTGYRAAIDRNNSLLRPSYNQKLVPLNNDVSFTSSFITKKGNLATLAYQHQADLTQPYASKLRNPVQELTFNWTGEVILDPPMDNSPDITTLPDIQVDFDGMYEAIELLAARTGVTGIDWGNWRTVNTVVDRNGRTTTTTTDQIRQGIQTTISPSNQGFTIGNFVENIAVRDYMRSRPIRFTGVRMKPNTRVWPYFDDELVSEYCVPTDPSFANTASIGSSLVTNGSGEVYGVFIIPNDDNLKFRIGTKRFELKDVANTQTQSSLITTSAHGDYTSIRLDISQRGSSINLVTPQFTDNRVSQNRTLTTVTVARNRDPLAQTFTVSAGQSEGIFVTKLDLYFGKKSNTLPVTVQIREVENGYPSSVVVPFSSKTLAASSVNVNPSSATTATTFEFDSPVFLKNNTDYAIIVLPSGESEEYALWVGQLGGRDVDTNELIHKQPSTGILFTSANDRAFSPIQNEDLKFKLYRAQFNTTNVGTVYIENDEVDYLTIEDIIGQFQNGEKVTGQTSGSSGFVYFFDQVKGKLDLENSTGGFQDSEVIVGSVTAANATITTVDNVITNAIVPKIPMITPAGTNASWAVRNTSTSGVISQSFVNVDLGTENEFRDGEKKIYSYTKQGPLSAVNGSKQTLVFRGLFQTDDDRVSPVIDLSRCNIIALENVINNTFTNEEVAETGQAAMRYITRPVELDDGQDAEDIKVFLTAYKPAGTDLKVYARIHNPGDAEGIDEKNFTLLTQITDSTVFSDSVDTSDYKEFEYGFSANTNGEDFLGANSTLYSARLNSANNDVVAYKAKDGSIHHTYKTFAIKIVATSSGTNIVPLVSDMRTIALQK